MLIALGLLFAQAAAAPAGQFPNRIDLPSGYFPEGIAVGKGSSFHVGSLADGSIYKGDLRTDDENVLVPGGLPISTVGIEVDNRERTWAAGGPYSNGRVSDAKTGALLASYAFAAPSSVNDVVVTRDAAYFTDIGSLVPPPPGGLSFPGAPHLFVVPLGPGGSLPDPSATFSVDGDVSDTGFPNLNGIETTPGGGELIVGHTTAQALYAVDARFGSM